MIKNLLVCLSLIFSGISAFPQPNISAWNLNTDGAKGNYQYYNPGLTSVNMTDSANVLRVCYDNTYIYVKAHQLADYTMGPWTGNPNQPSAQSNTFRFPKNPTEQTGTKTDQPIVGALGVAVNGVIFYGTGDGKSYKSSSNSNASNGDGLWNCDAWVSEGSTMDATGKGHPDQMGNYHYHATPIALYTDPSTSHSPIVGFTFDGFPVYGPFGYTDPMDEGSVIKRIKSSYQLRSISSRTTLPDGTPSTPPGPTVNPTFPLGTYAEDYIYTAASGDLDEYNGRFCKTPEYPSGIYAYFITTDDSGDPAYPYIMGPQYYGVVNSGDIVPNAGNSTIPSSGVTCLSNTVSGVEGPYEINFSVYPNPATDKIRIEAKDAIGYEATVTDALGKVISTQTINAEVTPVSLAGLEKGIYFISVKDLFGNSVVARFVKQ